ncbi:ABC transporter ATP-binding protein [Ferrovibrio sp.]|uniref:ABC transporter ATP-binding protein n=1 Tax=Ferrovibrio sp. TaxID=1917215 RepID=UPI0025C055E3|nr:ABC transporter ATP-binding protein [Ferrovibrio sp.]MBX3454165.1 ABC transporter ATP-binding protein [Ferrovibrio sp.]
MSDMSQPVIEVNDLKVQFRVAEGTIKAVDGVSFRVPRGKTVSLVGESGSGKSVVSQAIMGILPRSAEIAGGEILFRDPALPDSMIDIAKLKRGGPEMRKLQGGRISIIFQEPMTSLSPLHTIGNQIVEALRLHRNASQAEGEELSTEMLRLVGFPDPKRALNTYAFELSGGLRQRAMIAMALVCRPALLIADEPTTALDVTIQAQILKLIKDLQSELDMAVLMITHDLGVVANMADEIVVMYHGRVMERGSLEDIFRHPEHPYLKALLNAVPRFDMKPGERLVPIREIKAEVGGLLKRGAQTITETGVPLLEVKHLTKRFSIRKSGLFAAKSASSALAVDDVSFDVLRGECLGLVGESGCGKTTTSKMIMRAVTPDEGSIKYHDGTKQADVLKLDGADLFDYRRKVQFIFQDPFSSLNPRMTVFDIVSEPLVIHKIGDEAERFERVKELMTLVGLDVRHLRRYPHSFSGGQRQRIGIARALALQPDLLICDEPVSALDVSIQAQVLNLLKDLKKELGLTYLFISHNLAVVDYIADRIAVMCAGRLVELAPRELLFKQPVHPYTKALLAAVPKPDPSCRLDLRLLMEGKASNPALWAAPFTIDGTTRPALIDLGNGHFVRASAEADARELVA